MGDGKDLLGDTLQMCLFYRKRNHRLLPNTYSCIHLNTLSVTSPWYWHSIALFSPIPPPPPPFTDIAQVVRVEAKTVNQ